MAKVSDQDAFYLVHEFIHQQYNFTQALMETACKGGKIVYNRNEKLGYSLRNSNLILQHLFCWYRSEDVPDTLVIPLTVLHNKSHLKEGGVLIKTRRLLELIQHETELTFNEKFRREMDRNPLLNHEIEIRKLMLYLTEWYHGVDVTYTALCI